MTRNAPNLIAAVSLVPLLCACLLLLPASARAASPGQALVIGEANYTGFPTLPACGLSAHSVAAALHRLGFSVEEQEDASSGAVFAGITALTRHIEANPEAPVVLYICGYVSAFDERPFLLPVSAQVSRPGDLLTQGVLAKTLVDSIATSTKVPAVIALDAIPTPNGPDRLALETLTQGLPETVGLLAVREARVNEQPTALGALLTAALKDSPMQAAGLLTKLQSQLSGERAVQIAALHVPAGKPYLAQAPGSQTAPATPASPATASSANPPAELPATSTPAQVSATAIPDESAMTASQRQQVQQALSKLGYYDGRIDGIFGPDSRAAIRRWQHERRVPMTGHLSAAQAAQLVGG